MVAIKRFEELVVWKELKELVIMIYDILKDCRDRDFKSQLNRAAISVMNNTAEGFERKSNKEFRQYLYISKGSAGEVRSMLILGSELGYISGEKSSKLQEKVMFISGMLAGLIRKL